MRHSAKKSPRIWLMGLAILAVCAVALSLVPPPFAATAAQASPSQTAFEGQVIRVTDGDSITVRTGEENIKVRLAQIDAPESGQPWGTRSRQELADMVAGRTITIKPTGKDRYDRTIAQLEADGLDVNRDMVARGAAWAYVDYVTDPSMIDTERRARARSVGLWAMPENERVAPWVYRQQRRAKQNVAVAR